MKTLLRNLFAVTFFVFCIASSFAQSLVVDTQPNTSCGAPNGTASASVDGSTLDYTFRWYQGANVTGPLLAIQPDMVNLQAGTYTVTATHNSTAAVIGPELVTIQNNVTLPGVSIDVLSPYTNCVSPDGSLRAVPDGPAGDYSYAWYYGSSLPLGQGGQTATGLQSGIHTVRVTHNLTQCQTFVSATVPDQSIFPSVSINILSHLTSCTSPNGSVQAVPGGPASDYTYAWYQGPVAQGTPLSTGQTLSQLTAGAYTIQTTHKSATQCKAMATVNVQDNRPVFSASVQVLQNATSCSSPNGALKAVPSGTASSYTYKWYAGTAPQGTLLSTSQILSNRAPGVYTVLIRHKTSLCETVVSGTVQNQTPVGGIAVQVLAPSTSCISNNGALMVIPQGQLANYTYAWYEGATATGPVLSNGPQVYMLSAGIHTVVVTHIATQCQATINAVVPDERVIPAVSINVLSNETSCTSPNGSLEAIVGQGQPEDYSYFWFAGTTTGGPVLSTDATISGLSAGIYTVAVVSNLSQCESQISAVVQDEETVIDLFATVVSDQTSCVLPNGSLQAVVAGSYSDYTFTWYEGAGTSGAVLGNTPVIGSLPAGIYTVVATHNNSQCQAIISAVVQEQITPTVAYIEVRSNNTSCTVPDGQLIAVPQGPVGDYFYEWYAGVTPYISPILSVSNWVGSLPAGTYVVVITHKTTGCVLWVSQQVLDECQQGLMSAARPDNSSSQELSYYPNPVNGTLWINPGGEGSITISNFTGKAIRTQKLRSTDQTIAVDLSDQPAGMYILTFTSGAGTSRYHIMKQ